MDMASATQRNGKVVHIMIRAQAAEKAVFVRAAESAGLTLSAWIRTRLRGAAQAEGAGKPRP